VRPTAASWETRPIRVELERSVRSVIRVAAIREAPASVRASRLPRCSSLARQPFACQGPDGTSYRAEPTGTQAVAVLQAVPQPQNVARPRTTNAGGVASQPFLRSAHANWTPRAREGTAPRIASPLWGAAHLLSPPPTPPPFPGDTTAIRSNAPARPSGPGREEDGAYERSLGRRPRWSRPSVSQLGEARFSVGAWRAAHPPVFASSVRRPRLRGRAGVLGPT
jgi:hypothetical protein